MKAPAQPNFYYLLHYTTTICLLDKLADGCKLLLVRFLYGTGHFCPPLHVLFHADQTIASPEGVFSLSRSGCFRLPLVGIFSVRVNKRRFLPRQISPM